MADLTDDLILHIISLLPLKHAIRCTCLNKTFFHWISHPMFARQHALLSSSPQSSNTTIFHCSAGNPKIFTRVVNTSIGSKPMSKTLPFEVSILASCNGVLLLHHNHFLEYFVFNPITGGVMLLDYDTIDGHDDIGLAVDFEAADGSYHFKLVMVDIEPGLIYQSVLRFSVIVPPSRSVKSRVDFVCESFTRMENQNIKPVYAHGCLHWLGEDGTKIVAFNVEKEQARIINGPVEKNNGYGFQSGVYKWFGFSQGSLQFVYTLPDKIIIHVHNHLKNEWQVRHKIANICNPRNNDYRNGIPLFFDGERLFLQLRKRGKDGEIYMHEILSGKWEKKGVVRGWSDSNQLFIPFFPTLAKVSDQYLHNSKRWLYRSFRGLQQLLRHP